MLVTRPTDSLCCPVVFLLSVHAPKMAVSSFLSARVTVKTRHIPNTTFDSTIAVSHSRPTDVLHFSLKQLDDFTTQPDVAGCAQVSASGKIVSAKRRWITLTRAMGFIGYTSGRRGALPMLRLEIHPDPPGSPPAHHLGGDLPAAPPPPESNSGVPGKAGGSPFIRCEPNP